MPTSTHLRSIYIRLALCVVLLLSITVFLPFYGKTWFVESSGNIKIAPFLGLLFSILLFKRTPWAWKAAVWFAWLLLPLILCSISMAPTRPGFWLAAGLNVILLFLLHSRPLTTHFNPRFDAQAAA